MDKRLTKSAKVRAAIYSGIKNMLANHLFRSRTRRKKLDQNRANAPVPGEENIGKCDEHGEQIEEAYRGNVFNTQDEALDRRYSYSDENVQGLLGNRRRNIFGN